MWPIPSRSSADFLGGGRKRKGVSETGLTVKEVVAKAPLLPPPTTDDEDEKGGGKEKGGFLEGRGRSWHQLFCAIWGRGGWEKERGGFRPRDAGAIPNEAEKEKKEERKKEGCGSLR